MTKTKQVNKSVFFKLNSIVGLHTLMLYTIFQSRRKISNLQIKALVSLENTPNVDFPLCLWQIYRQRIKREQNNPPNLQQRVKSLRIMKCFQKWYKSLLQKWACDDTSSNCVKVTDCELNRSAYIAVISFISLPLCQPHSGVQITLKPQSQLPPVHVYRYGCLKNPPYEILLQGYNVSATTATLTTSKINKEFAKVCIHRPVRIWTEIVDFWVSRNVYWMEIWQWSL